MKPEDRKRLKQHIEMVVDHKTSAEELQEENRKLRLELHTLRFKESQEQRFIWWIWNVYAKNVQDLLTAINESVIDGADSIWSFVNNLRDYTEKIYDGTYLDVEISTDVKDTNPDYYNHAETSSDNNKGE